MNDKNEQKPESEYNADIQQVNDKINDVVALNQLVNVIVDYYSFKNRVEEDEDSEKWKKDLAGGQSENFVVPAKLDTIIEKAFTTQLKKFTT